MRAIDADELMEHVYRDRLDSRELIAQMVENSPTIHPEHTTWEEKEVIHLDEDELVIEVWQSMRCSKCERYYTTPYAYYLDEPNYCPYCGRKTERRI